MKTARTLVIALFGYAAMFAPIASQAASVEVPVPGGHVRLPAPPVVVIRGDRAPEPRHYEQRDRRYYREEHRHYRHDRHRHHDDYRHDRDHHRH